MEVTLHSTSKVVTLIQRNSKGESEMPARIWEGRTSDGIPVHAYVTGIACDSAADQTSFEADLQSHEAPSAELEAIPLRLLI